MRIGRGGEVPVVYLAEVIGTRDGGSEGMYAPDSSTHVHLQLSCELE